MPRRSAALLLALLLVPAAAARAQDRGSQADQDACTPDVFRLCQDFIPNEGPILACLKEKHAELSAACEPVIFPHSEAAPAAAPAPRRSKHRRKHRAS